MNELASFIANVENLTVSARSAARAFWNAEIQTVEGLVNYLLSDEDYSKRPKGLGEDNYKALVDYAREYAVKNAPTFIGITCTNGISFAGKLSKQDYAEFSGVVEGLEIWLQAHELK